MMINMDTVKLEDILKAIHDDGSYNDDGDWWTSFTDKNGNVYDINVYDDEFTDIKSDEVCIAVYSVDTKTLETDYSDNVSFILNKSDLENKEDDE